MQAVGRLPKQEKQKDIGLVRKLIKSVSGVLLPPKRRTAIANRLPRTIAAYAGLSERCESLVEHPWFDAFILFCIVLVGFATFVEMEFGAERGVMSIVLAYVQARARAGDRPRRARPCEFDGARARAASAPRHIPRGRNPGGAAAHIERSSLVI